MPSRLRKSAAAETVQDERRYDIPGLQFEDALTWRAGNAIAVGLLLTRLQKLAAQLRTYDVDQVDSRAFTTLAHDLANANLLGHKDKGVRAWTVACIVDVLKICAPDAPFLEAQLKDIFTVVINSILPALAEPQNAYNAQHVYALNSLAESQSILLVTDLPNHENLILSLFTTAFDIVSGSGKTNSGPELSKSVEYHLKNLLASLVDEMTLPADVTDIIISQFMRVDAGNVQEQGSKGKKRGAQDVKQATLLLRDYPPAYNMAKSLCTACPEKMTAQITQYFGTVIVEATAATSTNGAAKLSHKRRVSDLDLDEDENEGLADLRKAHRLLRELWRACPDVLVNVIPQIEAEFSADSPALRQLATETIGDITAGIGVAGCPPATPLDPAAYPLPSIDQTPPLQTPSNPLLTPASPKPFAAVHAGAYQSFFSRRNDRSVAVRESWAAAVSRILLTAAGGIGLSDEELQELLSGFAQSLRDADDRVRVAAIKSIHTFSYHGIIKVLGADGGLANPDTVFSTLAQRVTDRKHDVREAAIEILARIWGVASGDIEAGNEIVKSAVGEIPNRLLGAFYTNDPHVHVVLDKALYESLLPLSFPPSKSPVAQTDSQKPKAKDKEGGSSQDSLNAEHDSIRARRILTLIQSLDARSRPVFFSIQNRQVQISRGVTVFLQCCEEYNGGVLDDDSVEAEIKAKMQRYIYQLSKGFPEPGQASSDLMKFAKQHNRRGYQLIRYAMSHDSEYRTAAKAIRELSKRIREGPASTQSLIDTILPLLYRCALLVYSKSHIATIVQISRSDEGGLGEVAHEVLKEISARNPEVLKSHISALYKELEETSPSATKPEGVGAADTLKACAAFTRKYPGDLHKERKLLTALTNFALFSTSPRAAKHAVSIMMMAADKKDMYAKEVLSKALKDCEPESPFFLSRLATIGQVALFAPATAGLEGDAIEKLVVTKILQKNRSPSTKEDPNAWDDSPNEETRAKELALKVLVNRCRSQDEEAAPDEFTAAAKEVFKYLTALVKQEGEMTPTKDTPAAQKNRLRLIAVHFILKLCSHKRKCEEFVDPVTFNTVAMIMIHPPNAARSNFVNYLKKYLGHNRLAHRWFTAFFLLAFEPDTTLLGSTMTWIRARVQYFAKQQLQSHTRTPDKKAHQTVLESVFARLLSLLAHHPDYPNRDHDDFDADLLDFSRYIVFYLSTVATEDNLSLIFHIAQRVKGTRDAISSSESMSQRLYVLSDLSQAVIRNYADLMPAHAKGVNLLHTWPGQVTLPRSLFKSLPNHEAAQVVAEKNFLPEDVATALEKFIRSYLKELKSTTHPPKRTAGGEKKRKSEAAGLEDDEDGEGRRFASKKSKRKPLAYKGTPTSKRRGTDTVSPELPSRKSTRVSNAVTYAEADSEEDEAEMREIDRLASSPTRAMKRRAKREEPEEDEDLESEAEENGDEEVHVHEDEDAENSGEDEVMSDEGNAPPPLKEKQNAGGARKGRRGTKKSGSTKKTEDPKVLPERSARATRQTRSTKA